MREYLNTRNRWSKQTGHVKRFDRKAEAEQAAKQHGGRIQKHYTGRLLLPAGAIRFVRECYWNVWRDPHAAPKKSHRDCLARYLETCRAFNIPSRTLVSSRLGNSVSDTFEVWRRRHETVGHFRGCCAYEAKTKALHKVSPAGYLECTH